MAIYGHLCLLYLGVLTLTITTCVPIMAAVFTPTTLGTGSSSYKYEGAANEGGRGQSVWDKYAHEHSEKILDGSNGDVAVDQYNPYEECVYPAIYNFGDSNSDTGAGYATTTDVQYPNGISFFGSTSGRCCDGRLIIDYISEELELPYLSSYLNSVGSNYRHGANFAVASAPIRPIIAGLTHLDLQVSQFILFKSHTEILFNQISDKRIEPPLRSGLPRTEEFSKAIYIIDIGQNDISYGLQKPNSSEEEVRRLIPDIVSQFSQAMQKLYNKGARVFWIHNTGPIGCIPYISYFYPHKNEKGNLDANGCVKPHNELAQEYNRQLKDQVFLLRRKFPLAKLTYVDVYTIKYTLISNARREGFMDPMEFCCGSYEGNEVHYCGNKAIINGTFYGFACDYPSQYISWDGIHYSQAANEWIAKQILSGSFSDPPVSLGKAC